MKHHYWEPPIALYLFLGGLAGGILFLSAIFNTFVVPGYGEVFAMPVFWSLVAIAIGCVFLVVDLGQPGVFWRVWTTAKSIIKWGATFLVIAAVFALLYLLAYLGDSWTFFAPLSEALKPAAGRVPDHRGLLRPVHHDVHRHHAVDPEGARFLGDPALPVLFTISAISTGCAAVVLSVGGWRRRSRSSRSSSPRSCSRSCTWSTSSWSSPRSSSS